MKDRRVNRDWNEIRILADKVLGAAAIVVLAAAITLVMFL